MNVDGIGYNLDGEAVIWAANKLAQRPEKRRVLFVLSDGLPAGSRDNAAGQRYLREAVERVIDAGIEVYAIGAQSEHVKDYYPTAWVCHDMNDLINLAVGSLTDVLLAGRQEQQWVAAV